MAPRWRYGRAMVTSRAGHAAEALQRARCRASLSDRLAHRAWQLIAASQKRLLWRRLRGGAADGLSEAIGLALRLNILPRVEHDAFVSRARGDHDCVCCRLQIHPSDLEHQPRDHAGLYAHLACFIAWRDESIRLHERDEAPG